MRNLLAGGEQVDRRDFLARAAIDATTFCKQHEGCEKERYCMGDLVKLKKIETIPGKAGEKEKVGVRLIYEAKCGCHRDL